MIPVILGVIILIFTIMYFVPGDPATLLLGAVATKEEVAAKRLEMGLDDPYFVQLFRYLKSAILHFDFGTSYISKRPVVTELIKRFPRTFTISFICMILSLLIGIPLGINAALHQGKAGDTASMVVALMGVSVPAFWLALMAVILFALKLRWFPPYGSGGIKYYILPCLATCVGGVAQQARQTRSSMLEVMRSDFVTMARAKGVSRRSVVWKHMLPNALIPMITVAGSLFGKMLGGLVVTETVFSISGLGSYMINGVNNRDYPAVIGSVVWLAVSFSVVMLLVDLLYAFIDPRIKARYAGKGAKKKHG